MTINIYVHLGLIQAISAILFIIVIKTLVEFFRG